MKRLMRVLALVLRSPNASVGATPRRDIKALNSRRGVAPTATALLWCRGLSFETLTCLRSQAKLLCAAALLLCTACQPAFIGIDSDADMAAENCYAYRYGDKLRQINFAQAFDWCQRSARYGNAHSQTLLGELYYLGLGGAQDCPQAAHWFETAAKQGHAHAQYMLYRIYAVSSDLAEQETAEYWLQQARASGYKLAQ